MAGTSSTRSLSIAASASSRPRARAAAVVPTPASVRSMLRTVERVLLRDGGQRTALYNARSAVLEGEARAADRAEARASLQRLASIVE